MKVVNMHEAKTNLSRLVGEEFLIARNGVPIARVTPIGQARKPVRGFHPGLSIPEDFDSMAEGDIADSFEGLPSSRSPAADR